VHADPLRNNVNAMTVIDDAIAQTYTVSGWGSGAPRLFRAFFVNRLDESAILDQGELCSGRLLPTEETTT